MLKVIEEPQPNTLFLLVAQNQDQILNTILSRTQLVKIPCLNFEDIKTEMLTRHHQTETAASEIAYLANGNMTEALAILQQDSKSYHELLCNGCACALAIKALRYCFVDQAAKMGRENQKNFIRYGISF